MKSPAKIPGNRLLRAAAAAAGGGGVTAAATGQSRHAKSVNIVSATSSSKSSSSSSNSAAFSGGQSQIVGFPSLPFLCNEEEWEAVGEDELAECRRRRVVFGPAPSMDEVVDAVSVIQQSFGPLVMPQEMENHFSLEERVFRMESPLMISSSESESDWVEPTLYLCRRSQSEVVAHEKVATAFRLLQTNPSIKRAVVSLSSDRAVWEAVMRNEAVQELRESFREVESDGNDDGEQNLSSKILKVFQSMKDKMGDLVEKIAEVIGRLFWAQNKSKEEDSFNDALKSSFMLSVIVFIVVIISRSLRA